MDQKLKNKIKGNRFLFFIAKWAQRIKRKLRRPIVGKNNVVVNKGITFNVKYDIVGNDNYILIHPGAVVDDVLIFIRGNNHRLTIGANCIFKKGNVWFEDDFGEVSIGDDTRIESAYFAVTEPHKKITVGKGCLLAYNVEFKTGDSHSIIDNVTRKRINPAQNIEVGNRVWIGARSVILKGVTIADHSIVGTGSLVTKDVPPNSIVAGIPAKVIKNNIDWLNERI